jgi:membrane protease YdiL (CAAX protease family)
MVLAVAVEGGLIVAALLSGWLFDQPSLETFSWDMKAAALGLAATLPMLAIFFACLRWPVGPLRPIRQFCDELLVPLLTPCTILDFAVISILAGLGEEMLFRGVTQAWLTRWTGSVVVGLLGASVVFGLCHAITAGYVVLATLLGVYLGGVWLHTGNLLAPALAHAVYDFIALVVLVKVRNANGGHLSAITTDAPRDESSTESQPNSSSTL